MTQPAPPLPWLLGYRLLGLRLPEQYRGWVAEDVARKSFVNWRVTRTALWNLVLVGIYYVVQSQVWQPPGTRALRWLLVIAVVPALLESAQTVVRRTLRWQRIDRHGRPVRPKRLAVLSNVEAVVLGAIVLVLFTGGSGVVAHSLLLPGGPAGAPCREPDEATLLLIRGGLKNAATQVNNPRAVAFADSVMVAASVHPPGADRPAVALWLVQGDRVFEFRAPDQGDKSPTTFPPATEARTIDRTGGLALQRAVQCLQKAS